MELSVTPREFDYLRIQRGDLDHLSGNFSDWLSAYNEKLAYTFRTMVSHLPEKCSSLLDIGSGLGGIDALIFDHYQKKSPPGPRIHLLDGESDEAKVQRHDVSFNDMLTAISFLSRNGAGLVSYSTPQRLVRGRPFDLIVSFAAWCFHIHPRIYLGFVRLHCHPGSVLILDVRRHGWRNHLETYFNIRSIIEVGKKYDRMVLEPR